MDIRNFFGGGGGAGKPLVRKAKAPDTEKDDESKPNEAEIESAAPKKVRKVIADSDDEDSDSEVATPTQKVDINTETSTVTTEKETLPSPKKSPVNAPSIEQVAPVVSSSSESVVTTTTSKGAAVAVGEKHDPVHYSLLTDAFVKIEDITGRLEITAIMTKLFLEVMQNHPNDLEATLFLASNKLAPPHENVVLGIGEALISKVICQTFGRTTRAVKEAYDEEGDLGIVAEMSRSSQRQLAFAAKPKPLTITQVLATLREIATVEGSKSGDRKISTIQKMLRDCKGAEARFLVRALQGKLRIGLAETTVLVALAHAVVQYTPPVVKAQEGPRKQEVPLECEEVLRKYYESGKSTGKPSQEILDAAVVLVKQAFAESSDHGRLARALLSAPLYQVREFCYLIPGTPVSPMLAKPTKSVDEVLKRLSGQQLTVEFKYDGERMQLHRLADGTVKIFSRSQEDTTARWPEIANASFWKDEIFTTELAKNGDGSFVLDAEVVAWDVQRKLLLPFQVLSTRKRKAEETEEQAVRVIVQGFDLLYLHGQSLLRKPFVERRELMKQCFVEVEGKFTFAKSRDIDLRDEKDKEGQESEMSAEEGEQLIASFMTDAIDGSCEGLMVKTLYGSSATYEPSVRSMNWLKLKKDYMDSFGGADSLDLVPIGAYNGKGKRTGVWGAYLLACYDPDSDEFLSVCKIGTGFSDENLTKLSAALEEHALKPGANRPRQYKLGDSLEPDVYFKPVQVWEVRAADLSLSSTHKGGLGKQGIEAGRGIGLRFPRFLRERMDKPPTLATSSDQIRDLYFDQQGVANTTAMTAAEDDYDDDLI